VSSSGLIVVAPMAARIWRIVLRIEKGATGILHQVPTISDLRRLKKRPGNSFTLSAASVTGHNCNLLMPFKPGRGRCRLAIRQQRDRATAFEVTDDRSIPMVAPPSPVVDADAAERLRRHVGPSAYDPEQRVVADREH
jgi:hypothetical protein